MIYIGCHRMMCAFVVSHPVSHCELSALSTGGDKSDVMLFDSDLLSVLRINETPVCFVYGTV